MTRLTYHIDNNISIAEPNLNTGLNYLNTSLMVILSGFMAFGLILFNADVMSGEYNPGTLKFLLIQPVTRIKVLLSKYLSTVMTSIGLIVGIQLLFALGLGLINGFGSLDLPIMMGERYKEVFEEGYRVLRVIPSSGTLVDFSQYLLQGLLLEILFIFAMVAFIMMVSVISKSTVMAFTVLIGTLLSTNIVYSLSTTYRSLSPFIFLHHTNVNGILSGRIIQETGLLSFTYPLSIIVLTLSTLVFLGISMVIFKKRDILI
ncbi:MAG: ABC transporter permease subunit [Clostridium sp.]|nr:ABC transporter permease subunit [Clostridium sp.]